MENMIKSTNNLSPNDITMLRERFISDYSRKKGWDRNNLSTSQMLEIIEQKEYKAPGIIRG